MKSKVKLAALSVMLCANAIADPVYLPPGPNLTYGSSSNNQSIMSSITNPAAAAAVLGNEDSQFRFGVLSSIGGGYEFGNLNDLKTQIDSTKTTLAANQTVPANLIAYSSPGVVDTVLTAANVNGDISVKSVNSLLNKLQQDGNASVFFGGHIPLTPLVVTKKGLGGSIVLDANVSTIANISFIADPLLLKSTDIAVSSTTGAVTYTPTNDSTLLAKAAVVGEVGLGYSRPVLRRESGDLTAGVRAKYYLVKLARKAQQQTSASASGAQSTLNASQTYTSSSGLGLDVGTLWTAKRYRVGAWVNNLNKPSFKYNTIDTSTMPYPNSGIAAQINAGSTYEMKPQLELEGAFYSESQNWVLNGGLDANAVPDPVGRDFQWATLSAAYATNSWWIPGIRLGYRTNLAGSKLSYATGGLTLFKALSLDVAYGLSSVKDNNGKSIPRSFMANLGIQMTF